MTKDRVHYDDLTDEQKKRLSEIALSRGYRLEGTTDEEVKEFFRTLLKHNEEHRKKEVN